MIASTVSSKMLSAVAKLEGFHFEETLPGFKWMGHRAQELKVPCAVELLVSCAYIYQHFVSILRGVFCCRRRVPRVMICVIFQPSMFRYERVWAVRTYCRRRGIRVFCTPVDPGFVRLLCLYPLPSLVIYAWPQAQGCTILFAFEEAIGFGPGDVLFEKVTVSSLLMGVFAYLQSVGGADFGGAGSILERSTGFEVMRRTVGAAV